MLRRIKQTVVAFIPNYVYQGCPHFFWLEYTLYLQYIQYCVPYITAGFLTWSGTSFSQHRKICKPHQMNTNNDKNNINHIILILMRPREKTQELISYTSKEDSSPHSCRQTDYSFTTWTVSFYLCELLFRITQELAYITLLLLLLNRSLDESTDISLSSGLSHHVCDKQVSSSLSYIKVLVFV